MHGSWPPRDIDNVHSRLTRFCFPLSLLLALLGATFLPPHMKAQTAPPDGDAAAIDAALPSAPAPRGTSSLFGTVVDQNGAAVRGAVVTITDTDSSVQQTARTNRHGAFHFPGLPAGNYTVSVSGAGIAAAAPQPLVLAAGQPRQFPITVTVIPKFTSTVKVTATPVQIATAQVHVQEQQRMLGGVVPNFYTSFEWNAAPMTPKLKYGLALRSIYDPFTFLTDASLAGAEQYNDTYPGYGAGWSGYGKRLGAVVADSFDSRLIGGALLPSLLHQDPRYFYRGKGSFGKRLFYALGQTFVTRSDHGGQEFNYSRVAGAFVAAGISNVYHAPEDRGVGITMRDAFVILGGNAGENVLREFLSRMLTSHVPPSANGKP